MPAASDAAMLSLAGFVHQLAELPSRHGVEQMGYDFAVMDDIEGGIGRGRGLAHLRKGVEAQGEGGNLVGVSQRKNMLRALVGVRALWSGHHSESVAKGLCFFLQVNGEM